MRLRFGAWILCAFLVLLSGVAPAIDISEFTGTTWYGLYMGGKKIGYAQTTIEAGDDGTATVVQDAIFRLAMVGQKQDMRSTSERKYAEDGSLLRIDTRVDDPSGVSEFHALVTSHGLELRSVVGGKESVKNMPPPRETLADALKSVERIRAGVSAGDTYSFYVFEPMFQQELQAKCEVIGQEERVLDGIPTKVYSVKTELQPIGMSSVSYLSESGELLEDRIANGLIAMRLEPEAVAKDVGYENDTIVSNAAMLDSPIRNPRDRATLVLDIEGPITDDQIFNDAGQRFTRNGSGYRFEGRKAAAPAPSAQLPIQDAAALEWIRPTTFVQSDDERFIDRARAIVGDEKDTMKIVAVLVEWVSDNMRPAFSARLTNALEVLDSLEGDCTEHSVLFVALARAAGVPAREVAGLIYSDQPQPGFYFHQWAKVWVGEWMDVDPTFDQVYADATHVKLSEGDIVEQIRLLPVIGQLSISVVGE